MRRSLLLCSTLVSLLFASSLPVKALDIRVSPDGKDMEKSVVINQGEKVNGSLVVTGGNIEIKTPIEGDLICVGQNVRIEAKINGDVLCAAQNISIEAPITGSLRSASQILTINNSIGRNVTAFGQNVDCRDKCVVMGEFVAFAQDEKVDGQALAGVFGASNTLEVGGKVNKGIYTANQNLTISSGASVTGDVVYTSPNQAQIAANTVKGKVEQRLPTKTTAASKPKVTSQSLMKTLTAFAFWGYISKLLFSLVLGAVIVAIFPQFVGKLLSKMNANFWANVSWGLLASFIVPFVLILVAITIIGIPLSILGFIAFALTVWLAKLLAGIYLGLKLMALEPISNPKKLYLPMALGIFGLSLVELVPFLGWLVGAFAVWLGLGALVKTYVLKK